MNIAYGRKRRTLYNTSADPKRKVDSHVDESALPWYAVGQFTTSGERIE